MYTCVRARRKGPYCGNYMGWIIEYYTIQIYNCLLYKLVANSCIKLHYLIYNINHQNN